MFVDENIDRHGLCEPACLLANCDEWVIEAYEHMTDGGLGPGRIIDRGGRFVTTGVWATMSREATYWKVHHATR